MWCWKWVNEESEARTNEMNLLEAHGRGVEDVRGYSIDLFKNVYKTKLEMDKMILENHEKEL